MAVSTPVLKIDLRADLAEIERTLGDVGEQARTVMVRSINRTLVPVRATAGREIARDTRLGIRVARAALTIKRANRLYVAGSVEVSGKRKSLFEFGARATTAGVSYDLGRGRKLADKFTFIPARPPGSTSYTMRAVFRREYRDRRLPVAFLRGPSLPRVFVQKKIVDAMRAVASARWPREVEQQMRFVLSRLVISRG